MSKQLIPESLSWLYFVGIDVPKGTMSSKALILTAISLVMVSLEILQIIFNFKNINIVAGVIEVCGPVYLALVKIFALVIHRNAISDLLQNINSFWPTSLFNTHVETKLESMFVTVKTLLSMYRWLAVTTTTLIITLKPIFTHSIVLPVDIWQPFNMLEYPQYIIIYILESLGGYFCCIVNIAFDSLYVGYTTHLIAQLMSLKYALEHIPTHHVNIKSENSILQEEIKKCIKYHVRLLHFIQILQSTHSLVFLNIMGIGIINLCIDLYSAALCGTMELTRIVKYAFQCSYFAFLLFIYCYPSNNLTHHFKSISEAIYSSEWYLLSTTSNQKYVILIMLRAQKQEKLAAGKLIPLDLDNFIKMLRLAFSVFTIIRKQEERTNINGCSAT